MRVSATPPVIQVIVEEQPYDAESQNGRVEGGRHAIEPTLDARRLEARLRNMDTAEVQSPLRVPIRKQCIDCTRTVLHAISIASGVAILPSCAAVLAGPFWLVIPAGLLALSLITCAAAGPKTWRQQETEIRLSVQARTYDPR